MFKKLVEKAKDVVEKRDEYLEGITAKLSEAKDSVAEFAENTYEKGKDITSDLNEDRKFLMKCRENRLFLEEVFENRDFVRWALNSIGDLQDRFEDEKG